MDIEYKIVEKNSAAELEAALDLYLKNGWTLAGGVSVHSLPPSTTSGPAPKHYAQAVQREIGGCE